jgi:dihydrofolate reductase
MRITIIAAVSDDGVIGRSGDIPWNLPVDLRRFKLVTKGKMLISGRKTWDSLPQKPLPGRRHIVLTRDENFTDARCSVARTFEEATRLAQALGENEVIVIGGEAVYREALPLAHAAYITRVHVCVPNGDARFPLDLLKDSWEEVSRIPDENWGGVPNSEFCAYIRIDADHTP